MADARRANDEEMQFGTDPVMLYGRTAEAWRESVDECLSLLGNEERWMVHLSWMRDFCRSPLPMKQVVQILDDTSFAWKVHARQGDAEWNQLMDGVWRKVP